jgi:ABC-type multidrug transport system permease subunit
LSGSPGYLVNPDATTGCQYCPYSSGDEYLATLNLSAEEKWRDFGIFLAFCISNWALVYFFVWSVRIKGWSFGFGKLFGAVGRLGRKVKPSGKSKNEE